VGGGKDNSYTEIRVGNRERKNQRATENPRTSHGSGVAGSKMDQAAVGRPPGTSTREMKRKSKRVGKEGRLGGGGQGGLPRTAIYSEKKAKRVRRRKAPRPITRILPRKSFGKEKRKPR